MDNLNLPLNIIESSKEAIANSLPDKSVERYNNCYETFVKWQKLNGVTSFSEEVILAYFNDASKRFKPSTLWSTYSMLKSTIICHHNINIKSYSRLISFLKKKSIGFVSKKSQVLSADQIKQFLNEAPDEHYLAMKTILVFGIAGGCRGDEITNVKLSQVKVYGDEVIVSIPQTKTHVPKIFPIGAEFTAIVKKYIQLRSPKAFTDRFFLQFRQGVCKTQVIGRNKVANVPKEIAKFLKLDDPESYTGHSFRRSSATILADTGAGIETLKRFGLWKSNTVCEGYIQDSMGHKRKVGAAINDAIYSSSTPKRIAMSAITSGDIGLDVAYDSTADNIIVMSDTNDVGNVSTNDNIIMCDTGDDIISQVQLTQRRTTILSDRGTSQVQLTQRRETVSIQSQIMSQSLSTERKETSSMSKKGSSNKVVERSANKENNQPILHFNNCSNITIKFDK